MRQHFQLADRIGEPRSRALTLSPHSAGIVGGLGAEEIGQRHTGNGSNLLEAIWLSEGCAGKILVDQGPRAADRKSVV